MSVVTAHMVYFCTFARSEIFLENARKSGVGRGQFDAGVNGLKEKIIYKDKYFRIFWCQIEIIVFITLQIVLASSQK